MIAPSSAKLVSLGLGIHYIPASQDLILFALATKNLHTQSSGPVFCATSLMFPQEEIFILLYNGGHQAYYLEHHQPLIEIFSLTHKGTEWEFSDAPR